MQMILSKLLTSIIDLKWLFTFIMNFHIKGILNNKGISTVHSFVCKFTLSNSLKRFSSTLQIIFGLW